jgi:hypothetical protein
VCLELVGFSKYTLEESVSFDFLNGMVCIQGGATANDTVEIFAVLAQMVAIREEYECVLPADEFTAHG